MRPIFFALAIVLHQGSVAAEATPVSPRCQSLAALRDHRLFHDTREVDAALGTLSQAIKDLEKVQRDTAAGKTDLRIQGHAAMLLLDLKLAVDALKVALNLGLSAVDGRPMETGYAYAEQLANRAFVMPGEVEDIARTGNKFEIGLIMFKVLPRIGDNISLFESTMAVIKEAHNLDIDMAILNSASSQLGAQLRRTSAQLRATQLKKLFLVKLKEKIDAECGSQNKPQLVAAPAPAKPILPDVMQGRKPSKPAVRTEAKPAVAVAIDPECAMLSDGRGAELVLRDLDAYEKLKNRCTRP